MRAISVVGLYALVSASALVVACSSSSNPSTGGNDSGPGSHDGSGGGTSHKEGGTGTHGDSGSGTGSSHKDGGSGGHTDGGGGGGMEGGGGDGDSSTGDDGGGGDHDSGGGGTGDASTPFTGTVPTASAFGFTSQQMGSCVSADGGSCDGGTIQSLLLSTTNQTAATCSFIETAASHNEGIASTDIFTLVLLQQGTLTTGMFSDGSSSKRAQATYTTSDGTCTVQSGSASSVSVTLSTLSGSQATGTYNVTFGGQQASGSFTVPMCGALPTGDPDAGAGACTTPGS